MARWDTIQVDGQPMRVYLGTPDGIAAPPGIVVIMHGPGLERFMEDRVEDLARRGMTMISVTHEMGFARRVADLVVFMHQGKVWETGPTAELFANPRTAEFKQFVGSEL